MTRHRPLLLLTSLQECPLSTVHPRGTQQHHFNPGKENSARGQGESLAETTGEDLSLPRLGSWDQHLAWEESGV